jgi:hypothetical protein
LRPKKCVLVPAEDGHDEQRGNRRTRFGHTFVGKCEGETSE